MLKKIYSSLLLCFQTMSVAWGCNSTLLNSEVETMQAKIENRVEITEDEVRGSLNFLNDHEQFRKYKDENFFGSVESKVKSFPHDIYNNFGAICKKIYEEGDDKKQIAVSIFFDQVSKKFGEQYNLKKETAEIDKSLVTRKIDVEEYLRNFRQRKKPTVSPSSEKVSEPINGTSNEEREVAPSNNHMQQSASVYGGTPSSSLHVVSHNQYLITTK